MQLIRADHPVHGSRWAVRHDDGDHLLPDGFSLATALSGDVDTFRETLGLTTGEVEPALPHLAPIDPYGEVWAAGVTYRRSQQARVEESSNPDIYQRVYDAPRPELFFKSLGWRVSGAGQPVAVRSDSTWDVPEPELAIVVTATGDIAGYTICNDVSSRSIEGDNPLYLPQAKTYLGATALGPGIRPVWEVADPYRLTITMDILRAGSRIWSGRASTGDLHRRLDELVDFLFRADRYPGGVVLSTGTCLVPDESVSLTPGDVVEIAIDQLGHLTNPVAAVTDPAVTARARQDGKDTL